MVPMMPLASRSARSASVQPSRPWSTSRLCSPSSGVWVCTQRSMPDHRSGSPGTVTVPEDFEAALAEHPDAKAFFETLKGANRYAILYRIQTAVKPETRTRRIAEFVAMLQRRETLYPKRPPA